MSFHEEFQNPSSEYRGKPFWSWNGELEPTELRRQLRVFQTMGMGGAFLHSRVGLKTPYLGDKWFECIQAGIDECDKLGMEAWLYDEDRWPSGSAGGMATKQKKYRMHLIVMEIIQPDQFKTHKGLMGAWQAELKDGVLHNLRAIPKGKKPARGFEGLVLVFHEEEFPCYSWYNGNTYLDVMDEESVKHFIEVTHEPYAREIGDKFGKLVPGIFTDEPNYGLVWPHEINMLDNRVAKDSKIAANQWTRHLPKIFKEKFGYDIRKHLPELFFNIEGQDFSQARYHYRSLVTDLFVNNFSRLIGEWCAKHNMDLTGHVLLEETLRSQTYVVGSAMRFYEFMQAPGIDVLTQYNNEYNIAKQCASVQHQMGRKWVLSELYGCTGWDFTWEGHKAVGDWQTAMGVNLRCHHLSWYTMEGEAKRDYPASIFFQSPWWQHYAVVEDYYSRLHVALTKGEPVRRLLVVHPVESMWMRFRPPIDGINRFDPISDDNPDVNQLSQILIDLRDWLLQEHIDYDYGDEDMISRLSEVKKSKDNTTFQLGQADYDVVLVPPQLTIRQTTLDMLKQFAEAGGTVIFAGDPPAYVDASENSAASELAQCCGNVEFERSAVVQSVKDKARRVSICDAEGQEIPSVLYMLRQDGDTTVLFICNTDRQNSCPQIRVSVQAKGQVQEWDPMTGQQYRLSKAAAKGKVSFDTDLPATGSRLFVIQPKSGRLPIKSQWHETFSRKLVAKKTVQLDEPNVLVLDTPTFQTPKHQQPEKMEILRIDRALRDQLGTPHRGGQMLQPWARKVDPNPPSIPTTLNFEFEVKVAPVTPLHLVLETPERYTLTLNGHKLAYDPADDSAGWWVDPCLRRIVVDPVLIQTGTNLLTAEIDFTEYDDLEAFYLTGDFGVKIRKGQPVVTEPVRELKLGNWVNQGLPFYSSAVTYHFRAEELVLQEGSERVVLQAPGFEGACARVFVNGKAAGFLPWPPYELDLTEFLTEGKTQISVQVISHRRNTFGPLHLPDKKPGGIGPDSWMTGGNFWSEEHVLVDCGLMEAPVLSFQRKA